MNDSHFLSSGEVLDLFLYLNDFYQNRMCEYFLEKNIKEVDILGYSSTGIYVHNCLMAYGIKVNRIYDKKFLNPVKNENTIFLSSDQICKVENSVLIICSSRKNSEFIEVIDKFKKYGYKILILSDIVEIDDNLLFAKIYPKLPLKFQKIIYDNYNNKFWDEFGNTWYEKIRYSGGDRNERKKLNDCFRNFICQKVFSGYDKKYFEIGIGRAENFGYFKNKYENIKYYGSDISYKMLCAARKEYFCNINLINSDLRFAVPVKSKMFDISFTSSVIQHIEKKRIPDLLNEIIRITKISILHFEGIHKTTSMTNDFNIMEFYEKFGYKIETYDFYKEFSEVAEYKSIDLQCFKVIL